jgi:HD domain
MKYLPSLNEAYRLLEDLGAPPKLILHVRLVNEAAEQLIAKLEHLQISIDRQWIILGVAFHDAGKILHPGELIAKGNHHEATGETLLLNHGLDPKISRCCRSHAQWQEMDCALEELCVALADNLWKGKRNQALEKMAIDRMATGRNYWEIFMAMDGCFESIAAGGDGRLLRSV